MRPSRRRIVVASLTASALLAVTAPAAHAQADPDDGVVEAEASVEMDSPLVGLIVGIVGGLLGAAPVAVA